MNADRQFGINTKNKTKSTEKLSSGYRINRSADDAAGLSISEKMRNMIRGLDQGSKNIQDGISFVQTGDGAMNELHSMIGRIRELAVKAANDTNAPEDREAIDMEIQEIKREINTISERTKFNGLNVFCVPKIEMGIGVDGIPQDLNTFNATYDNATGKVTYGGFIFNGERISWDKISGGMVSTNAEGKQVFNGGEYTYTAADGTNFTFSCEKDDEVPTISRTVIISASGSGINIDGTTYSWDTLKDENGKGMSDSNIHKGAWVMKHKGADLAFYINDEVKNISDMAEAVNECHTGDIKYTWKVDYDGPTSEDAVPKVSPKTNKLLLSNKLANEISNGKVSFSLRADSTGMWLENDNGTAINDSKKSWDDLGISSFNSGNYINSSTVYKYSFSFDDIASHSSEDDINIEFMLSDVTSVDSIIDELDGMKFSQKNYTPNHAVNIENNSTIGEMFSQSTAMVVTPGDEIDFGRNFNIQTVSEIAHATPTYDNANDSVTIKFNGNSGVTIELDGSAASQRADMKAALQSYAEKVKTNKQILAERGFDPQGNQNLYTDLKDLIGEDKITTSGYMSEDFILTDSMVRSDGFKIAARSAAESAYKGQSTQGTINGEYFAGKIDFSDLGSSYTLDDLKNLGFDSTCATCDNHYSIRFVNGVSGSIQISKSGYTYSLTNSGLNYLMEIDINSLKDKGIDNGTDFTKALVEITAGNGPKDELNGGFRDSLDFHFSQYVADGATLYVCDARGIYTSFKPNEGRTRATFYTQPYDVTTKKDYTFNFNQTKDADPTLPQKSNAASLKYSFDHKSFEDSIVMNMQQNDSGSYVRQDDGTYIKYDSAKHSGIDASKRFNLITQYKDVDGNTVSSLDAAISSYSAFAMKDMLENTTFTINSNNYMYYNLKNTTGTSTAIRSTYSSYVEETPYEDELHIQNSGVSGDCTRVPRYKMTTVAMGIFDASALTRHAAENSIKAADRAASYVSSCRSRYGAVQNRMEYTYNNNQNYSENLNKAESLIRDTDMAEEMVNYSKQNILEQVAQAMISQANQQSNAVLSLLQS